MSELTFEEIERAYAAVGLRPCGESISLLGQEITAYGRDAEDRWHLILDAARVTGHWDGEWDSYHAGLDAFRRDAGLFGCDCPCECWYDECTRDGCQCHGCKGPNNADVRTVMLSASSGRPVAMELIPFTALFRAMHFGPWSAEWMAALKTSGLMDKLLVSVIGDAPMYATNEDGEIESVGTAREHLERNGPIEVDGAPLVGSPVAFLGGDVT